MKKAIITLFAVIGIGSFATLASAQTAWKTWGPWYLYAENTYNHTTKTCSYQRDTVWYSPGLGVNYGWDSKPIWIPINQTCPATIPE